MALNLANRIGMLKGKPQFFNPKKLNQLHYNKLLPHDKDCYMALKNSIIMHLPIVECEPPISFSDVLRALNLDNPEFYYVNWSQSIHYVKNMNKIEIKIPYIYKSMITDVDSRLAMILSNIDGKSTRDVSKKIHDKIIQSVYYDFTGLQAQIRKPSMWSLLGPLLEGTGVCEGISKIACYMLRKKGIPAAVMSGSAFNGQRWENHAWNALYVNNAVLHSDITFDIALSNSWRISHKYHHMNDKQCSKEHKYTAIL